MAGGAGVEYYFGYSLPAERPRLRGLAQPRAVVGLRGAWRCDFFARRAHPVPRDGAGRRARRQRRRGRQPLRLREAGRGLPRLPAARRRRSELDLGGVPGRFTVAWLDPRRGAARSRLARSARWREAARSASAHLPPTPATTGWPSCAGAADESTWRSVGLRRGTIVRLAAAAAVRKANCGRDTDMLRSFVEAETMEPARSGPAHPRPSSSRRRAPRRGTAPSA